MRLTSRGARRRVYCAGRWESLPYGPPRAGRAGNLQRTVGRDRRGREFWTVSSLRDGLTLVLLPDEM